MPRPFLIQFLLSLLFLVEIHGRRDNEFLYSPKGRVAICEKKEEVHVKSIIEDFACLGDKLKDTPENVELVKQCWKEVIGVEYPSKDDDWIKIYCDYPTPYYLKNIAADCFFRKMIGVKAKAYREAKNKEPKKETKTAEEEMDSREEYDFANVVYAMVQEKKKTKKAPEYLKCFEVFRPLLNYQGTFEDEGSQKIKTDQAAAKKPRSNMCPSDNPDFVKDTTERLKCIETKEFPKNKSVVDQCWKDIIYHTPYPTSDDEWQKFLCSGSEQFPLAMAKLYEDCAVYRVSLGFGPDSPNEKDKGSCNVIDTDDEEESVYYEQLDNNYAKIKVYNEICHGKNKEVMMKEKPSQNLLKCLSSSLKDDMKSLKIAVDYCWGIQASVLTPKGAKPITIPKTDEEWMSLVCSLTSSSLRNMGSLSQGNRCLSEVATLRFRDGIEPTSEEFVAQKTCHML